MHRRAWPLAVAGGVLVAAGSAAAQTTTTDVEIVGHVVEPQKLQTTSELIDQLALPEGLSIGVFADGLINPRMLAVAEDGTVYVTRRSVGDVVMLRDEDGDGTADVQERVASRPNMHGIAITGGTMYLATIKDVYRTEIQDDGTLGELTRIIDDLPDAGQHPNRTLGIGPDGMLYISSGSTCNACDEANPENAAMLRASRTAARGRSSLPGSATPSASTGTRRPGSSTASTTASTGWATTSSTRS